MNTNKSFSRLWYAIILLACVPCWWSCGNVRQLQYMQGQFDTAKLSQIVYPTTLIQKNDLLSITVYSDNPLASAYYNLPTQNTFPNTNPSATGSQAGTVNTGSTYLVDEAGSIRFPGLGILQVAGLTKEQVYQLLQSNLADKLQNPYFIIRMANYRVTLIGEINSPGQFNIPNERVSLLEAIGLAGDLTIYGRRDNVLIIREMNGQRTFGRVNLTKPEILSSPYFYLQPNDVVYVDLNKQKAASADQTTIRNLSLATSVISVLAILIGILR